MEVDAVDREGTPSLPNLPALGRITIGTGDGTEQGQYKLPWKNKGGTEGVTYRMNAGEVLSMNAQVTQGANGILCRISVDGEVVVENTSTGEYAVVSCVASVE
ncbi:hypothetical protein [Citricoccus sp.]|uniref:hypothetical protein n=1 Tax=Citricoccus sp. TaxID=1978372 RepID=UPI002612D68B|nr:hypothetical protein [Citricoccus sp.]HRO31287.1 hypothetical protein [Citricoccus sp.]